jgi:hypothetical protein
MTQEPMSNEDLRLLIESTARATAANSDAIAANAAAIAELRNGQDRLQRAVGVFIESLLEDRTINQRRYEELSTRLDLLENRQN